MGGGGVKGYGGRVGVVWVMGWGGGSLGVVDVQGRCQGMGSRGGGVKG